MTIFCRLGLHSWPRQHGTWHEPVVEPTESNCRRCQEPIRSIWRVAYPADGSRCGRFCQLHGRKKVESESTNRRATGVPVVSDENRLARL